MNQILQFYVFCQFKDVFVNLQCFNLFLCSHIILFFCAKVAQFHKSTKEICVHKACEKNFSFKLFFFLEIFCIFALSITNAL